MKPRSIAVFTALIALLFSVAAMAATNKKEIRISEPVLVGSATLQPGEYTVQWIGTGPDVQVSFSRERNTIVTVPATLERGHTQFDNAVTLRTEESGIHSLVKIETKGVTLYFGPRE